MEDKIYFADYITEEFKSKIDSLGKSKYTDSTTLKVKDYTFIFVDETEYISKQVEEIDLSTTKIDNYNFNTIVVLLNIKTKYEMGNKLSAPVKGKMQKDIFESISSLITITLKKGNNIIFSDTSTNCGLEIVQN